MVFVLVFTLLPVYAFASDNHPITVSASGNQVTISGASGSYAGKSITLRLVDRFSRTIMVDEVKAQADGGYLFGPYTLDNGAYTAYVGGKGTVEVKAFNVSTSIEDMSSNANLQMLTVSTGMLDFNTTTTEYNVHVGYSVSALTITAVPEEAHASVKINSEAVTSKQFQLLAGDTPVSVEVTAQDGTTTKTYTMSLKKAAMQTASSSVLIPINSSQPVAIAVPAGVTKAKVSVAAVTTGSNKTAALPLVEVQAATPLGNIHVAIPAGTQITAPAGWDGTISLPEVQSSSNVSVRNGRVSTVIEVGSPDVSLTFDKAVRILLPNQAGKSAGYIREGILTPITGSISADKQAAANSEIAAGGDALLTVGSDLVIWTKHFTRFISYMPNTPSNTTIDGGGGGGGASASIGTIVAATGGTLTLNGVKIIVPAEAADNNFQVTVDQVGDITSLPIDKDLFLVSNVYDIKKDRDGEFSKPVIVTIPYDKTKVDSYKSKVGVYQLNEQTHAWIQLDGLRVDQAAGTVSGNVSHFTKFAVMASNGSTEKETQNPANVVNFSDIRGHWGEAAVLQLVKQGMINGYPDNTFKPNERITRAEFVALIVKAFNFKSQSGKSFTDTSTHWAQGAISTASALGVVDGYNESTFGPDDLITREQMATLVIRAARLDSADPSMQFSDSSSVSDWARSPIATATAKGLINGYEDGTVRPKSNATRAEAAAVVLRVLQMKKQT